MVIHRIFFGQQYRIVTPCNAFASNFFREFDKRVDTMVDVRYVRFHVFAVCRDSVVTEHIETIGNPMKFRQNRSVVFRTEHHTIHYRRVERVFCNVIRE